MYLDSLLKFETIIMSRICLQIITPIPPLSLYSQTKSLNMFDSYKMVKQTINTLQSQSSNFNVSHERMIL